MNRSRRVLLLCVATASVLGACRPESQPENAPPRPSEDGSLRPLTSRDEAPAAAAPAEQPPNPHGGDALPAGHPPLEQAPGAAPAAVQGGSIQGAIEVAPTLKGKVQGGALFVIARNTKTRQIVAVRKMDDASVPQKFDLSATHAMVAGTAFEGPFNVTARWSQRGDAMPQPGDIEGTATDVAVGSKNVKIVLSEVRK